MQFINICITLLLVNFDIYPDNKELSSTEFIIYEVFPLLNGQFTDFEVGWYIKCGANLCVTLTINIISPHITKIIAPLLTGCLRSLDRGCCKDLKKKPNEKNDDEVNTKKTT